MEGGVVNEVHIDRCRCIVCTIHKDCNLRKDCTIRKDCTWKASAAAMTHDTEQVLKHTFYLIDTLKASAAAMTHDTSQVQKCAVHTSCVHCTHALTCRHCGGHCSISERQITFVHTSCVHCTSMLTGWHSGGHCGISAQRDTGNCCTHIMCALHAWVDRSALWRP
jgi:hypothetical protein